MKARQTFEIVECAESKIERKEEVLREVKHYLTEMSNAGIIAYPKHLMKRIDWALE